MDLKIEKDDLTDGSILALLTAHRREMDKYSPVESIHALNADQLNDPALTFWGVRIGGRLAGCGALKEISPLTGEVKSMKTHPDFIRRGVAALVLERIIAEAGIRGYRQLFLETGSHAAFDPAVALYEGFGFRACGPFTGYEEDPYSRFFCRDLRV